MKKVRSRNAKTVETKIVNEREAHQQFTAESIYSHIRSSWLNMLNFAFREIKRIGYRKYEPQPPRPHALYILD